MADSPFPHLHLLFKDRGDAVLEGGGSVNPNVKRNQENRAGHATFLKTKIGGFSTLAKKLKEDRAETGLPTIAGGMAFVLQIPDEDDGTLEFLAEKLGLEIVAEYEDGFLIVASEDLDLKHVIDLANDFAGSIHGSGGMAKILDIDEDPLSGNRIGRILDERLLDKWPFPDDEEFILDVSIEVAAFGIPTKPTLGPKPKPEVKAQREVEYADEKLRYNIEWDEKRIVREDEIERFVRHYKGEICSITDDSHVIDFPDSFSARIRMNGKGFKDLIQNYPNLFEASLPDEIESPVGDDHPDDAPMPEFELLSPVAGSPSICIIDSGIQENHRWLEAAIDREVSRCFIPGKPEDEVADYVKGGGHGTRVAGACLYPQEVPKDGAHQPAFYLLNARVLDENNWLPNRVFPADLLHEIVGHFQKLRGTRIFQHSVAGNVCFRSSRMSIWATCIDLLAYRYDVLFIQAAGNIRDSGRLSNPGILDHLQQGRNYPNYLFEAASRLANPAQSLQALTVGSISSVFYEEADRHSISKERHPSSFSRTGFGMWDSIKPEIVEFGGDDVIDGGNPPRLTNPPEVCPELVRSTLNGGPSFAKDVVGTSFAAPKVANLAGHLAAQFPNQGTLLYRALIVNSARWPTWADDRPLQHRPKIVRAIGYGVPDLSRATENTETRITLITEGNYGIKATEGFIFGIPIPEELRRQGDAYRIRIDVTLSYVAEPRRTRKSRRGYLGVWLDWKASKKRESFETFRTRALKDMDGGDGVDDGNFQWTLGNKKEKDGQTDGVSRRNGTVQKDWVFANSYELPDVFGIVVRGHKGWDRQDPEALAHFALVVSFEAIGADVKIYQYIKVEIEAEIQAAQAKIELPG